MDIFKVPLYTCCLFKIKVLFDSKISIGFTLGPNPERVIQIIFLEGIPSIKLTITPWDRGNFSYLYFWDEIEILHIKEQLPIEIHRTLVRYLTEANEDHRWIVKQILARYTKEEN